MRSLGLLALLWLVACGPQYVETIATSASDLPERRALFTDSPAPFHIAFHAACSDPGDSYLTPRPGLRQCKSLPTPELAAFLLLEYDGALEIPTIMIQTKERPAEGGVEVAFSYYAEIPLRSGGTRRIYYRDSQLEGFIDLMLIASGGQMPD